LKNRASGRDVGSESSKLEGEKGVYGVFSFELRAMLFSNTFLGDPWIMLNKGGQPLRST
jgi:hypothetical protein